MSKARDLANAGTALTTVSATELGYLDGVTSAVQTQIDAQIPDSLLTTTGDTIYASGASTPARLGIGSTGQVLTVAGGVPTWATPSSGATQWTFKKNLGNSITSIATNGSNIIVAVGDGGFLSSSTDTGATWTTRTSGFGVQDIRCVAYGGGVFVAVGYNGLISSSSDGITWTARTAGVSTNALHAVDYVNNTFVAVGVGAAGGTGGITTSTDGTTWTKRTTPATTSSTLYSIAYGNGYYVAVGSFNTTAGIYSTNLSTWTALSTTLSQEVGYVTYQNNGFMAWTVTGVDLYTIGNNPSGSWTGSSNGVPYVGVSGSLAQSAIKPYNSKFYSITSSSGTMAALGLQVFSQSYTNGANLGIDAIYQSIPYPTGSTSASLIGRATCLHINNSGVIWIAVNFGRIYTAQL